MNNKDLYSIFCEKNGLPIFSQPWWLDAVSGPTHWDVAIVQKNGTPIAAMPYFIKKKWGIKKLTMPPLTQTLGPHIRFPINQSPTNKQSFEHKIMKELIDQLPAFHLYSQHWHARYQNWLPFYWAGFKQTTRYTYQIQQLSPNVNYIDTFRSNIRTDIKKARAKHITVSTGTNMDDFIPTHKKTFKRQHQSYPYNKAVLYRLDALLNAKKCRKLLIAKDNKNQIHAAIYIVWDATTTYYLMGAGDPDYRNSGATSLLLLHAIEYAASQSKTFDFEGSMKPSIETFFRAFGATQVPYFHISKTNVFG